MGTQEEEKVREQALEILRKSPIERTLDGLPLSFEDIAEFLHVSLEKINEWADSIGKKPNVYPEKIAPDAPGAQIKEWGMKTLQKERKAQRKAAVQKEKEAETGGLHVRPLTVDERIHYIQHNFKVKTKAKLGRASLFKMLLWRAQEDYIRNRTVRDIILKGRQMGFSTGVLADNAARCFTEPYHNMAVITHDGETSEFLLQTVQRFHDNLPPDKKPTLKWSSANRKYFPELDAYIYVDSARSDTMGIGHNLTIVHLSEVSRWPDKKARDLFAGISQTVPMEGYITVESTPRGRVGIFYEMWEAAKKGDLEYKTFFYPWWFERGYTVDNVNEYSKDDPDIDICARILGMRRDRFLEQEMHLLEKEKMSPGQIAFRRKKIKELRELFFQEYPENDVDCWLSAEMAVIDGATLRPYYQRAWDGVQDGPITTWKDVEGGRKYVIGVDVASGAARDYSVASVVNCKNLEYVARLRGKIHPDLFGEELYRLGRHYNDALIAVERAGHGHSVLKVLLEKNYPNLWYHTDYDEISNRQVSDVGWNTSAKTKLPMVNGVVAAVRSGNLLSYSMNFVEECAGLTWENGIDTRIKTGPSGNDDEFIAISIALQVRETEPVEFMEYRPKAKQYARVI